MKMSGKIIGLHALKFTMAAIGVSCLGVAVFAAPMTVTPKSKARVERRACRASQRLRAFGPGAGDAAWPCLRRRRRRLRAGHPHRRSRRADLRHSRIGLRELDFRRRFAGRACWRLVSSPSWDHGVSSFSLPDARGPLLRRGRFFCRSAAPGSARAHHPRPFRSCPRRPRRGAGDARDARHHGGMRYGDGFCRREQAVAYGESAARSAPSTSASIPPAMFWARRRSGWRMRRMLIVASGDYKREPDPTCAAFEPVACDVFITEATFGLPVFRHRATRRRDRQAARLAERCFRSARISSAPIRSARRSASSRCCARPATTGRSICTARWRSITDFYASRGDRARRIAQRRRERPRQSLPARS